LHRHTGNISAGKSTLCRELAASLGFELFLEPVVTNPYLELYYGDAAK
jgi:deoxyadenosine/deoxycytidine kinase